MDVSGRRGSNDGFDALVGGELKGGQRGHHYTTLGESRKAP